MSEERLHRCFFGVPVAPRLLGPLADLRARVLGRRRARPTPDANLHLTLQFLGGLDPAQMERAVWVLEACRFEPLPDLQPLDRAGGFPAAHSPLVAVEGPPTAAMQALVATLAADLATAGLPVDQGRRWRPHITLAKRPRGGVALPDVPCALWLPVETVVLYESMPLPEGKGVEYREVARRGLTPDNG